MQNVRSDKFVFHESLNAGFLDELFEGDSIYAETVFEDFLNDLPAYWDKVETAYRNKDMALLGTCIHTCKTLFGYVGFTDLQEFCQEFENSCGTSPAAELRSNFDILRERKLKAQQIIENEYERLKKFNKDKG